LNLKKIKPSPIFHAFFIGFMIGIIIFRNAKNSGGVVTLIAVFLIYGFKKKIKNIKNIIGIIKKRNLFANS